MKTKPTVGLIMNTLSPDLYGEENLFSKNLNFKNGPDEFLTVFVDKMAFLADRVNCKHKVALLAEPSVIETHLSRWMLHNYDKFDAIITFQKEYCNISPKFKFCPIWVRHRLLNKSQEECRRAMKFYPKDKDVSAIFSTKMISLGHELRYDIRSKLSNQIDIFGRGHRFIENKIDGIKDYRYHVCVETTKESICSMLLTDAVLCGTVPIYWGNNNSNVNEYFNMDGVILFENIEELRHIVENVISPEDYQKRIPAMKQNFDLAKNLNMHDIWWEYCIKDFFVNERRNNV